MAWAYNADGSGVVVLKLLVSAPPKPSRTSPAGPTVVPQPVNVPLEKSVTDVWTIAAPQTRGGPCIRNRKKDAKRRAKIDAFFGQLAIELPVRVSPASLVGELVVQSFGSLDLARLYVSPVALRPQVSLAYARIDARAYGPASSGPCAFSGGYIPPL